MLGTILVVVLIIAVGSKTADNLRVRQQEVILAKLPQPDAVAYYDLLRRRVRTVGFLRAVTLVSLAVIFYAWKYRLAPVVAPPPAQRPAHTAPVVPAPPVPPPGGPRRSPVPAQR